MKKFSKKSVLLFAGAMAICAFVLPSVASAASWGPVGSHHVLDSPNIGFTSAAGGGTTSSCTRSSFTARVVSGANLQVSAASFGGLCTFETATLGRCTATSVGQRFPWTGTATSATTVALDGVHIGVTLSTIPGHAAGTCGLAGGSITITGNLGGGNWTGNAAHALDFSNAAGLVSHSALGAGQAIATRGLITDTSNSLVIN